MRRLVRLLVPLALGLILVGTPRDARADVVEVWARLQGAVMGGGAHYFEANGGPRIGAGVAAGLRVTIVEAYVDLLYVANQTLNDGSTARTYFNQLGAGLRIPVPVPGPISLYGRVNANYANAPYVVDGVAYANSGIHLRAGGGLRYDVSGAFGIGVEGHAGYGIFGTAVVCDAATCSTVSNDGPNGMAQLFLRLGAGF